MSELPDLAWYRSQSADAEHDDQEVDLDAIGSPGGASWASVSPDSGRTRAPWVWVIYDRWIDVDSEPDPVLAEGGAGTEAEAKTAIATWVRDHPAAPAEPGAPPAMVTIRTDPLRGALLRMLIDAARSLNEDSAGQSPGVICGEYARGQAELICDTIGLAGDRTKDILAVITVPAPITIITSR